MRSPSAAGVSPQSANVATVESDGRRKLQYLQGLRGCAALVVVLHHYAGAFYPQAIFGSGIAHAGWEEWMWRTPLGAGVSGRPPVCLFFILSGYVLSLPYFGPSARPTRSLGAAMIKRPIRLGGLVMATMICAMILSRLGLYFEGAVAPISGSSWLQTQPEITGSWLHFLADLMRPFSASAAYNQPLWTITVELIGSYLTFGFLLFFRLSRLRWWFYGLLALIFHDSLYLCFGLGVISADLKTLIGPAKTAPAGVTAILVAAGVYFAGYPRGIAPNQIEQSWHAALPRLSDPDPYAIVGAFLCFIAVLLTPALQRFFSRPGLVYLGRISFALYAFHLLLLRSASSWCFLQFSGRWSYNVAVLLTLIVSVPLVGLVAHVATLQVDEPVMRWANAWARFWEKRLK
jgi:peptidoglycan/LPS O-acetylase OafA/YrhL